MALIELPFVYDVFAHHDCMHNQLVAISNRVCGAVPEPDKAYGECFLDFARSFGRYLPKTHAWSISQFVDHYHGPKRVRYQEAAEMLERYGLDRSVARVKMFIKCEKIAFKTYPSGHKKNNPDPRAIQFRDPIFSVAFGMHLKPIEEKIYRLVGKRWNNLPPTRCIGKGLNQKQRASLLEEKMQRFSHCVVLSLDMSRFDQHVSELLLRAEHAIYKAMDSDPLFSVLCDWQIVNVVTTSKGIRYTTRGKRMSGDMNTALGNCIIVVLMVSFFFKLFPGIKWDLLDDGDDMLLLVEAKDMAFVEQKITEHFLKLGMEVTVDPCRAQTMPQVNWCQSSPIQVADGWKFIRDPAKVISGALVGQKWLNCNKERRGGLCHAIGLCELVLNAGVPILQEFALALVRNASMFKIVSPDTREQIMYRVRAELGHINLDKVTVQYAQHVTDTARETFEEAFGISSTLQRYYEEMLHRWTFTLDTIIELPTPIFVPNWEWVSQGLERYLI